jgi:hypothetical protein
MQHLVEEHHRHAASSNFNELCSLKSDRLEIVNQAFPRFLAEPLATAAKSAMQREAKIRSTR